MYIKTLRIKNYKLFPASDFFEVSDFNIPNGDEGSGLSILVGENGCGKTTILDALAMPYVSYKAEGLALNDINNPDEKVEINILTDENYTYKGTMPKQNYVGKGFSFVGGIRSKGSKTYLSSMIVTDQKYIKADGVTTPKDGTPDLRLSVNNPWAGSRFNEIEYLILDNKRTSQTRKGTFNDTRFDRLLDDLNYHYCKQDSHPLDCNGKIVEVKNGVFTEAMAGLGEAIARFSDISGNDLKLKLLDNWMPFSNAFLGIEKDNLQTLPLNKLGSGYEIIFSLIYAYYMSKKGNKKLIVLIDEPELHLHPKLQLDFVKLLLEFSKDSQIIISTHSPLLVKQAMESDKVHIKVLRVNDGCVEITSPSICVLPYHSANEINYIAFNLATEEYHNELYEFLMQNNFEGYRIKDFDVAFFQGEKGEVVDSPWMGYPNEVTKHTFIRNKIHHRADNGKASYEDLLWSIERMRGFALES